MMDLGASVCRRSRPDCASCPVAIDCNAQLQGRQDAFPGKKPKKTIPAKPAWLIVLELDKQVWLIKRPPAGIWGGLWCFPEFESELAMQNYLDSSGYILDTQTLLPGFRHTFSHFHLDVQPVRVTLKQQSDHLVMEPNQTLWYNIEQPSKVGLAAATERVLASLETEIIKE